MSLKSTLLLALIALVVFAALPFSVSAQDLTPATCSDADLQGIVSEAQAQAASLQASDDVLASLKTLDTYLRNQLFTCEGLSVQGGVEEGKQSTVIGPIAIPSGLYRAILVTDGKILLHLTEVSGDCDSMLISVLNEGDSANGTESLFKSDDCVGLFEINLVSDDWKLVFHLIDTQ